MRKLYKKLNNFILPIILVLITGVFFIFTSPFELPLLLLVVPFVLLFVTIYVVTRTVVVQLGVRNPQLIALTMAVFSVVLLLLGSLHQLSFRDIVLSIAIVVLLTWYIRKMQQ
jgi:hypothetical protein